MSCLNNLVLIMPYYGKLPPYFPYYLQSLSRIKVDVLFVTDINVNDAPENLHVVHMTFDEVRKLAAEKLKCTVGLETPKKLCDFKPMYGKIFEDYLKEYDYWAMGDCDLVYGVKFNEFIDFILREKYDVVSMRKKWISGAFCALKNTPELCNLFMRANNWKEVVAQVGSNNLFDECGGSWHHLLAEGKMSMEDCERICDSFGAVVWRSKDFTRSCEDRITEDNLVRHVVRMSADGRLYRDDSEIMLFHFIGIKFRRYCHFPASIGDTSQLVFDEAGLYVSSASRTFRQIVKLWRKASAVLTSLKENGVRHWIGRIWKSKDK